MKMFFATLIAMSGFSTAYAGFAPTYKCSNLDATIVIDMSGVAVLETKYPADVVKRFTDAEVKVSYKELQILPVEKHGCSSREVEFMEVTIEKLDGSSMPNAYNKSAENGALKDYVICARSHAWFPPQGQTCN